MKKFNLSLAILLATTAAATSAFAAEQKVPEETAGKMQTAREELTEKPAEEVTEEKPAHLTGDWGGFRTALEDKGVDISIVDTYDAFANVSGGLKESQRAMNDLAVELSFDGEKMFGVHGLSGLFNFTYNNGGRPDTDLVGSAQGFDNYESDNRDPVIYQAYIEQKFMEDKASILFGLYEINNEFYVTDSSGLLLNSTFGLGTEFAATGQNGPSTWPYTSLGTRIKFELEGDAYLMAGVFDGVPGDPDDPNSNNISFHNGDGALLISEVGINPEDFKVGVGLWGYTEEFPNIADPTAEEHNMGFYFLSEKEIYKGAADSSIKAFARFGIANGQVSEFDYAWSAGFTYNGVIPGRPDSQLGFGVTQAHNSDEFRDAADAALTPVKSAETTAELTYSDKPLPWLTLQPDVQYIMNPGTTEGEDDAVVIGMRAQTDL